MHKRPYFIFIITCIISFLITSGSSLAKETKGFAAGAKQPPIYLYILGPSDVVQINVLQHPELSGTVTVAPDETIALPLTGDAVRIGGLTKEEASGELEGIISKYVKTPQVSLNVIGYNSKVYYVLGEVGHPGRFSMAQGDVTIRDAIVTAGLPTKTAVLKKVHIITPDSEKPTYKIVDIGNILYKGKLKDNALLKPGDVVYVPRNGFVRTTDIINRILGPFKAATGGKSDFEAWK